MFEQGQRINPWLTAVFIAALMAIEAMPSSAQTRVTSEAWGSLPDGQPITRYTLTNTDGARASFMPYGAAVLSVEVPDRDGVLSDVALGYASAADYATRNTPYFGLTIGRYAGRIAGSTIMINGETFELAAAGRGSRPPREVLHGGPDGFSNRVWQASVIESADGPGLRFKLVSPDGDQGFPGEMSVSVTYHWTDDYRLIVDYEATTSRPTVINLTQHSYFNLAGAGNGDILDHSLQVNADFYTFATPDNLPTGEIVTVRGTPFDFTTPRTIGQDIDSDDPHMQANRGFNQNFVLRRADNPEALTEAAVLRDPESGRTLTVLTTEPGLFLYTANFIDTGRPMKGGVTYPLRAGVALETGHFPDSPNQPHFPSTALFPGDVFTSRTVFAFSAH